MKRTIIFGGEAGQGPNILADIVARALIKEGYFAFYSRDYESLIRGGHNFNTLTFSDEKVFSNESKADILVCLDNKTEEIHKKDMKKNAILLKGDHANMFFAGSLFKIVGIEFSILDKLLKELGKRYEENFKEAKVGYESEKRSLKLDKARNKTNNLSFMNGSQAISISSIKSGLNFYYSYPMTPATPVMFELGQAQLDKKNKHKVIEMENEISVICTALGSSIAGKVAMVGTSGGGFDLMTEALSLAGMADIPIVIYLAQRPGPSTGVATYTSQGDLNVALYGAHGEFSRVVLAPGNPEEAMVLVNNAFYLSQKFRIPCILLSDKHLAESKFVAENGFENKIKEIKSSIKIGERFNSYEHDSNKNNVATQNSEVITKNFEKRMNKQIEIEKECSKLEMLKVYGNKNSKNLIISWGSTKGAIIDAISEGKLDAKFIQVLFLEPFPSEKIKNEIEKAKKVLVVENNAFSPLSKIIAEKTGFFVQDKNKILKYDGRPFFCDELASEIKIRLK